ncbi:MAG: ribonuclease III [Thermomicrobiales bacterium]
MRGAGAKRKPSLRQMEPEVAQAAAALNMQFARWDLLREALIHRSYLNEDASATESNERLEFLGDAALGFIVARYLFDRFKDAPEGQLTRRRMALVSNQTLARWARRIGIDRMLLISKGERGIELPDRVLGGAFEALLAAILLDRGSAAVEAFLVPILDAEADELVARTMAGNFKGRLQEIAQERERITPTYQTLDTPGADHERRFTVAVMLDDRVLATGQGKSKQIAEQAAAEAGLSAYIAQERAAANEGDGEATGSVGCSLRPDA